MHGPQNPIPPDGPPAARPMPPDPRVGTMLGKYRIVGMLGRGAMGVVYEALDTMVKRTVAVKLLPESLREDPGALERFLREARAAGRLNHPNAVCVLDVDEFEGSYCIVMELVRGGSAADLLKSRGELDWAEATRLILDVCRGLEAAHEVGLVHRDIKPANLMLTAEGVVKVADFGLAKSVGGDAAKSMSGSGALVGTPQYMSPEQCHGERLDGRCDIYSTGATYYALLTGRPPFDAPTSMAQMLAHISRPAPDPRRLRPEIPARCSEIIRRAMAKDPADRYPTAGAMAAALEAALAGGDTDSTAESLRALTLAKSAPAAGPAHGHGHPHGHGPVARRPAAKGMPPWAVPAAVLALAAVALIGYRLLRPAAVPTPARDPSTASAKPAGDPDPSAAEPPDPDPDVAAVAKPPVPLPPVSDPPKTTAMPEVPPTPMPTPMPLPAPAAGTRPARVLVGHKGAVNCAAFDVAAGRLVTGGEDGRLIVWNDADDAPLRTVESAHAGGVTSLLVGRGRSLASGGRDGSLRIWDWRDGWQPRAEFRETHRGPVRGLGTSSGLVVSVGGGDPICRWTHWTWARREDPNIGRPLPGPGTCLAIADDGDRFAAGSEAGEISLGDIGEGQIAFRVHEGPVAGIAFTSGHTHMLSAGADGLVLLWDTADPDRVFRWAKTGLRQPVVVRARGGPVTAPACSPWNDVFAYAEADGTIRLHRLADNSVAAVFRHGAPVRTLLFLPGEPTLISGGDDGTVKYWDWSAHAEWKSVKPLTAWAGHAGAVQSAAFSPDGARVLTGGAEGAARLWDSAGKPQMLADGSAAGGAGVQLVGFSPDGSQVLAAAAGGTVRRWSRFDSPPRITRLHTDVMVRLAATADLTRIGGCAAPPADAIDRVRPRIWELSSGRELPLLPDKPDGALTCVPSPDGRTAVVGVGRGPFRIVEIEGGREAATLPEGQMTPQEAVFLPDGKSLALWTVDRQMRIYDARTGRELRRFHTSGLCPAFSRDGAWLAGAGPDGTAELRESAGGRLRAVLTGVSGLVTAVAISCDGRRVLAGADDGTLYVWDVSAFTDPSRR